VNDCLACLDQVTQWLDEMERTGELPVNADGTADAVTEKFAGSAHDPREIPSPRNLDWLKYLKNIHGNSLPPTGCALYFRPDPEAFFRGEDPLAQVAKIDELVVVDLSLPRGTVLENIDPFACAIEIVAATTMPIDRVRSAFEGILGEFDIVELDEGPAGLSAEMRSVLEAQVLLLGEPGMEGRLGRLAAAGRVTANVMRHNGRIEDASRFADLLDKSLKEGGATNLIAAIRTVLDGPSTKDIEDDVGTAAVAASALARVMRVDSGRIDALVNLTGELTVVKNAFGHISALAQEGRDPKELVAALREQQARFDRLVGELQRAVLRIRVLPLRQVFQRFPRLVREISASVGKSITFVTEGDATEADAAIVESLFEPLLHVLRNAIDHGSEDTAQRMELGKPAASTIVLRARRQLENVVVEVEDDGRGIDVNRVRDVAGNRNLLPQETLANMSDPEIVNLIFAPGFSTASEVTGLSGRGVGMDSVKAAVERVGGNVSVDSAIGRGTIVRLTLPFTVMMTRVMTVETGGQVFGFPLDSVVETAIVARADIAAIGRGRAFTLRDRTIPLIDLAGSLSLPRPNGSASEARVVVTSSAGQLGGIEVEKLGERMDVMLKPMDGLLKNMRGVAGTTLLGDGRVLIVLDVQEIFQ
jgi:two-component system chemotaxis sensor kinase CheA